MRTAGAGVPPDVEVLLAEAGSGFLQRSTNQSVAATHEILEAGIVTKTDPQGQLHWSCGTAFVFLCHSKRLKGSTTWIYVRPINDARNSNTERPQPDKLAGLFFTEYYPL